MQTQLSHAHQHTLDAILSHPEPHNLHWRDVRSMLDALGADAQEVRGDTRISHHGRTLVLHHTSEKDVGTHDHMKELRAFLVESQLAQTPDQTPGLDLLVVIDHRLARIYQTETRGSTPSRVTPYDPNNERRHLHYVQDDSNGQRRPERRSFYDDIAASLQDARRVLLFGSGTGASSAMNELLAELAQHHKPISAIIVGSEVIDEHHLTEDQILAKARAYYATLPASPAGIEA
jgi:hypothetical protein